MTLSQNLMQLPPISVRHYDQEIGRASCIGIVDDIQCVADLLKLGQARCTQAQGGATWLSEQVQKITQNRAQLYLGHKRIRSKTLHTSGIALAVPVQFNHLVYGTLCITQDTNNADRPALSHYVAQLMANVCSWLLYTFEQSYFLQGQCQRLDYQVHGPLTRREHEVLTLMYRGYDQQEIADMLCISPATVGKHRQHIYERLGVHNERDALLVVYHTGLLSFIEDEQ